MEEKYMRKHILGKGSQGEVWLVENVHTGTDAAMKCYPAKSTEAKREMMVLKSMGGRGIPYLIDCMETEQKTCIVMEYVKGKSLRQHLSEQAIWTQKETMEVMMQIAQILYRFHRQMPAMIYGDLKPENVILTSEGEVYLIDFGSVLYEGEKDMRVFGTRAYLPPVLGERTTPYRDTYGMGVMMYEMLTGCRVAEGALNGKADLSHLTQSCKNIAQKAVRLHETEGYQDAGKMYEDMKAWVEETEKTGRKRRWKKKMGRRKKQCRHDFICDLKRLVLHGRTGVCFLLSIGILAGVFLMGREEIQAAKVMGEDPVMTRKEVIASEKVSERTTEKTTEKTAGEETTKKEEKMAESVPRDEYGRKLVIRK